VEEGFKECGQSHFVHSHHFNHLVETIVVLEIETTRFSKTSRHLTNANPRLHLSIVSVHNILFIPETYLRSIAVKKD
jgi:hypothetical protein